MTNKLGKGRIAFPIKHTSDQDNQSEVVANCDHSVRVKFLRPALGRVIPIPLALLFFLPALAWSAGFDCTRATTNVERMICGNPDLSRLDEELSKTYDEVLHATSDPQGLKRSQLKWLRDERDACTYPDCLTRVYRSRLGALESLSPRKQAAMAAAAASLGDAPLAVVDRITNFYPADYPMIERNGRVIFSQYEHSGNNFDVLSLDPATEHAEPIVRGIYRAQFVAESDRYRVIASKGQLTRPLTVTDLRTGKTTTPIRLQQPIKWAKIEGDRLIAFQGYWGGGYGNRADVLIFELPSLKILKSATIAGGNDVHSWHGNILSLGQDVVAYDNELNELFRIKLPPAKSGGRCCCPPGPMRLYADKAVVVTNCGQISTIDLTTRQVLYTIPSYSLFYAVAIVDGLIFTAPHGDPPQRDNTHVYDLATGKELAVLPINATDLFAKGNRLLAVEREFAKVSPMTLYVVNPQAIRSGTWRLQHVLDECRKAELLISQTHDLYAAIGTCKASGIEGLIRSAQLPKALMPVARQYALWLSQTLDRGEEAIALIQALQKIAPDADLDKALTEVDLKSAVLNGQRVGDMTDAQKSTDFGRLLVMGSQLPGVETKHIDFGAFSNIFLFSGDRVYIGRYAGGASIGVLDRTTFNEIGNVPIAADDNEYQDNITSIAVDKNRIYASVGYRYEQAGRPDFYVVDKKSLKLIKAAQINAPSQLLVDAGRLFGCGCSSTTEQKCKAIDPQTLSVEDVAEKICVENQPGFVDLVSFKPGTIPTGERYIANTRDYLIGKRYGDNGAYTFYPKVGGSSRTAKLGIANRLGWPVVVEDNMVIVNDSTRDSILIKAIDANGGTASTLFGVPNRDKRYPAMAIYNHVLFVGVGRDLLIYDLRNRRLRRYIKEYVVAPPNQASNVDSRQITRLLVDRDRLITLTFSGSDSRIARVADLVGN